jgi:hypothetical protein
MAVLVLGGATSRASDVDPRVARLVDGISSERLGAILRKLESFETRHTLSTPDSSTRGIGAAREWIRQELQSYDPKLQVSFDAYQIPKQGDRITRDAELRNVMAILPGRSPRRIYVSGHYDSVARRPDTSGFNWSDADGPAPGVNDDGSGTALTMELARVFAQSRIDFDATLVFMAFAGEEQGLVGAKLHAQMAQRESLPIVAVFNNDIVGNTTGGDGTADASTVRVFSEGPEDSPSRQLARFIKRQAARYVPGHRVELIARHDRFGRGGDHTAFNQHGFAGVRFSEARENYSRQHTVDDTLAGVSPAYLARNAQVNAAVVATMALAPPAPIVVDEKGQPLLDRGESGYDARLRWKPAAGATAYRVFWRAAWTLDWQHEIAAGNVIELVLKSVSIDNFVFGVAAVGEGGNESPVAAYVNPPRPETDIKTK